MAYNINDIIEFRSSENFSGHVTQTIENISYVLADNGRTYAVTSYGSYEQAEYRLRVFNSLTKISNVYILGVVNGYHWSLATEIPVNSVAWYDWLSGVDFYPFVGNGTQPVDFNQRSKMLLRRIANVFLELLRMGYAYGLGPDTIRINIQTMRPIMLANILEDTSANLENDIGVFSGIVADIAHLGGGPFPLLLSQFFQLTSMSQDSQTPTQKREFSLFYFQNPLVFTVEENIAFMRHGATEFHDNHYWVIYNLHLNDSLMSGWQQRVSLLPEFLLVYNNGIARFPNQYQDTYKFMRFRQNIGAHPPRLTNGDEMPDNLVEEMWIRMYPQSYFVVFNALMSYHQHGAGALPERIGMLLDLSTYGGQGAVDI